LLHASGRLAACVRDASKHSQVVLSSCDEDGGKRSRFLGTRAWRTSAERAACPQQRASGS